MWAYCDTSALLKRYVRESGRESLARRLTKRRVVSSIILPLELHSALARRVALGALATIEQPVAWEKVSNDRPHWTLVELTSEVISTGQDLIERYPLLRTLDAIHVASAQLFALRTRAHVLFVSADARQLKAAASLGFETAGA